jgi:hypothetical protein
MIEGILSEQNRLSSRRWHFLNFFPDPQGHFSFLPIRL